MGGGCLTKRHCRLHLNFSTSSVTLKRGIEPLRLYSWVPGAIGQTSAACMMPSLTGAQIIARTLRDLDVKVLFGIVGIPVVEIAEEAINLGIQYIGFRNEQAASYAASVYGYLTGRPGACLVVGGPGVLHAISGVRWMGNT